MNKLPKLSELTPEQMRVMCAEACHPEYSDTKITFWWTQEDDHTKDWVWPLKDPDDEHCIRCVKVPRYDTSLNAMAEAEATLSKQDRQYYFCVALPDTVGANAYDWMDNQIPLIAGAAAIQRLAAFLIAKGLAQP